MDEKIVAVSYAENKQRLHFAHRKNLLERQLRLPLSIFQGSDVIEFGPNGGENSLFLFFNGAK